MTSTITVTERPTCCDTCSCSIPSGCIVAQREAYATVEHLALVGTPRGLVPLKVSRLERAIAIVCLDCANPSEQDQASQVRIVQPCIVEPTDATPSPALPAYVEPAFVTVH